MSEQDQRFSFKRLLYAILPAGVAVVLTLVLVFFLNAPPEKTPIPPCPEPISPSESAPPESLPTEKAVEPADEPAAETAVEKPVEPSIDSAGLAESASESREDPLGCPLGEALDEDARWFELERENFERSEAVRAELDAALFKRRLPNGYGALEIDDAQRAEIYRIQEEYHRVLTPLYQRADRLRAERDRRIRAVLTAEQQKTLENRKKNKKKNSDSP